MNKKLEFFSSMAVAFIVLILVFLCIRFSGQGKFATHGGTNPSDVKCIYTSVWPDNEYTIAIQQIIANSRRNGTSLHSPAE